MSLYIEKIFHVFLKSSLVSSCHRGLKSIGRGHTWLGFISYSATFFLIYSPIHLIHQTIEHPDCIRLRVEAVELLSMQLSGQCHVEGWQGYSSISRMSFPSISSGQKGRRPTAFRIRGQSPGARNSTGKYYMSYLLNSPDSFWWNLCLLIG